MSTRALSLSPHLLYNPNPFFDSACHRALRCAETLDLVLQEIDSWTDSDMRRSARSLALTCRAFLDPAAAVLWKELPDLQPLYAVLSIPGKVLKTFEKRWNSLPDASAVQSEKLPDPRTDAWSRFLRYAALVRKLRRLELQGFELQLFQILVGRNHGKTFLPYLREFAFAGFGRLKGAGLTGLSILASPVRTLEICSYEFNDYHRQHLDCYLAPTVSNTFPNLQHLTLAIQRATNVSTDFFTSFTVLKQLRHLNVEQPIIITELSHLQALISALPQLESLSAGIMWMGTPPGTPPASELERTSAPCLRRLVICGLWEDVALLPSLLQCPALEDLELSMRPTTGPVTYVNCDTLCACVREVAEPHFAPRLRRLVINAPVSHQIRRNRTQEVVIPERRSIADILGPLSALEHLEDVRFTMVFVVKARLFTPCLSDGDMRALAAALRHVRTISLQIEYPAGARPSPTPTLLSLAHFASLCPRLVSLSLPYVNTKAPIPPSTRNEDSPPLCKTLRTLRLPDATPLSESETCRLAAFLCGLFPDLDVAAFTFSKDATTEAVLRERMYA